MKFNNSYKRSENQLPSVLKTPSSSIHFFLSLFLIFATISGCSSWENKDAKGNQKKIMNVKNWRQDLTSHIKKLCFQGEGRGTLREKDHSYSFSYESVMDFPQQEWKTAFYAPLHGEETLFVQFATDPTRVSGSIVDKLARQDVYDDFYKKLGLLFRFYSEIKTDKESLSNYSCVLSKYQDKISYELRGICTLNKQVKMEWVMSDRSLLFRLPLVQRVQLEMNADEATEGANVFFSKVEILLKKKPLIPKQSLQTNEQKSEILSFDFALEDCR